jgi:bifunctional DNase/RNase
MSEPDLAPVWRVVTVAGVQLELPAVYPEVILTEAEAPWRELRIPVGLAEGSAIAYAWRLIPTPRPLTHELMAELLDRHGVDVAALRITARQGTVYLAEIETSGPRGREVVPCRPSDGLALILRQRLATPVLVAEGLFDQTPADVPAPAPAAPADPPAPVVEPSPVVEPAAEAHPERSD